MEIVFTEQYPDFGDPRHYNPPDYNVAWDGYRAIWREAFYTLIEPGKVFLRFMGQSLLVTAETSFERRLDTPHIDIVANGIARALREATPLRDRFVGGYVD